MCTVDDFDRMLYEGASLTPPELPEEEPPKPWKAAVMRICWGLILINFTLNFWYLDIILPSIGAVLLWQGLRPLRRENGGFRFAGACAAGYAALRLAAAVLLATPFDRSMAERMGGQWSTTTGTVPLWTALRATVLQAVLALAAAGLWLGLKGVFHKAGQRPRTAAVGALAAAEFLMIPLALIGVEGWLLVGPLILLWALLLRGLWKLSASLDEAGYALTPAPVKCPAGVSLALWLGPPLLAVVVLPLLFARLPVDSRPAVHDSGEQALRAELAELGVPEELLSRLPDEQAAKLEGAYGLTVKGDTSEWDSAGEYPDGSPGTARYEIPVRDEKYGFRTVYLIDLCWDEANAFGGGYMEGIQVTPDFHGVTASASCPQGALEWTDSSGVLRTAPLDFRFHTNHWGLSAYVSDFSLPKGVDGEIHGYLLWEVVPSLPETVTVYNSQVGFVHRSTPWQYPYTLPSELLTANRVTPGWVLNGAHAYTNQLAPEGVYEAYKY